MQAIAPLVVPGYEPSPDGPKSDQERAQILMQMKQMRLVSAGIESPVAKAVMSGGVGFGLGAFFSLMGASMSIEDPFRAPQHEGLKTLEKAKIVFRDMGKGMWQQGKGFAKVGALYAGSECVIEGYRAKNDIYNALYAGMISGAVLARNSGARAMVFGGLGFAAFSGAIDLYMRKDKPDEDA